MADIESLSQEQCEQILARNRYGRLGCFSPRRDHSYVTPLSFDYHNGSAYCISLPGQKIDFMREHPHGVCLEVDEVDDAQNWMSVVAIGDFEELSGPERLAEEAPALKRAYNSGLHYLFEGDLAPEARDMLTLFALRLKQITGRKERWTWEEGISLLVERTRD